MSFDPLKIQYGTMGRRWNLELNDPALSLTHLYTIQGPIFSSEKWKSLLDLPYDVV